MMAASDVSGTPDSDPLTRCALERVLRSIPVRLPRQGRLTLVVGAQAIGLGTDDPFVHRDLAEAVRRGIVSGRVRRGAGRVVHPFIGAMPAALCWQEPLAGASDPRWLVEALIAAIDEEVLPALANADPLLALEATSPTLAPIVAPLRRIAQTRLSLLITGPTGTGKEVLARAIHASSDRRGAFVAENCAALPEGLLETELFGHARGAFTGAGQSRRGRLLQADRGSILLDEVGDMPLPLQAKLLRALQEGEVRPIGGQECIPFDARVLSATHHDLDARMGSGQFRQDLYYRLAGSTVRLPALADRIDDLPYLCSALLEDCARNGIGPGRRLELKALRVLAQHSFPGNVRELQNLLTEAAVLSVSPVITEDAMLAIVRPSHDVANLEAEAILRALAQSEGIKAQAARRLGWSRQRLYRRIQALDLPV